MWLSAKKSDYNRTLGDVYIVDFGGARISPPLSSDAYFTPINPASKGFHSAAGNDKVEAGIVEMLQRSTGRITPEDLFTQTKPTQTIKELGKPISTSIPRRLNI